MGLGAKRPPFSFRPTPSPLAGAEQRVGKVGFGVGPRRSGGGQLRTPPGAAAGPREEPRRPLMAAVRSSCGTWERRLRATDPVRPTPAGPVLGGGWGEALLSDAGQGRRTAVFPGRVPSPSPAPPPFFRTLPANQVCGWMPRRRRDREGGAGGVQTGDTGGVGGGDSLILLRPFIPDVSYTPRGGWM